VATSGEPADLAARRADCRAGSLVTQALGDALGFLVEGYRPTSCAKFVSRAFASAYPPSETRHLGVRHLVGAVCVLRFSDEPERSRGGPADGGVGRRRRRHGGGDGRRDGGRRRRTVRSGHPSRGLVPTPQRPGHVPAARPGRARARLGG